MVMIVSDMSDKILLCEQARQDKWVVLSPSLIIFEAFDWEPKIWPLSEQYFENSNIMLKLKFFRAREHQQDK